MFALRALVVVGLVSLSLGGCASGVRANVSYFYDGDPPAKGTSVAVVPNPKQAETLEWEPYAGRFVRELERVGFSVVRDVDAADLIVRIDYSFRDSGKTIEEFESTTTRQRGWKWQTASRTSRELYDARVLVRFEKRGDAGKARAEVRVMSRGTQRDLTAVIGALAEAAFKNWPGEEARVYRVTAGLD